MRKSDQRRKERILNSVNFKNDAFQNRLPTPMKPEGVSYFKIIRDAFRRPKNVKPFTELPAVKTDLARLQSETPVIVWFGHSSYLIHCKGYNILVDPVFCGHAAPFSFMVKAFRGSDAYTAADMPVIDALILTHNHYDHFDGKTLTLLQPKIKAYYTPLGTGALVEKYSKNSGSVNELDWWETAKPADDIQLTAAPARHFSGRGLKRNGSLWASFVLELFDFKIFLGGDSGYDVHFKEIGEKYGPFDLAILECGQYNTSWPLIHMMPEETVQAAVDLQAKVLLPVHWGKFALASHPWNEPIQRAIQKADELQLAVTTPRIGEPVILQEYYPDSRWWIY